MCYKLTSENYRGNLRPVTDSLLCFAVIINFLIYTALFLGSENEAASTLSSLVDMPHQTRLVELLIASPEVRNNTNANSYSVRMPLLLRWILTGW